MDFLGGEVERGVVLNSICIESHDHSASQSRRDVSTWVGSARIHLLKSHESLVTLGSPAFCDDRFALQFRGHGTARRLTNVAGLVNWTIKNTLGRINGHVGQYASREGLQDNLRLRDAALETLTHIGCLLR